MRLQLDVFGDQQVDRELLRWETASRDMSPALEAVADDFLRIEGRQFATSGGFSGGWAALDASYVAAKVRRGLDPRILRATGALEASLTKAGDANHVRRITSDEMFVGTSLARAAYHQRGDGVKRRRPVELRETDRREWIKILQSYLATGSTVGRSSVR